MFVRFRVNLGSIDAAKLKLDHKQCQLGAEVDVPDAAAEWLCKKGIAEPAERKVKGVAKQPEVTAPAKQ
jgi:hypothetical protein